MTAYAIFIREQTIDADQLKIYGQAAGKTIGHYDAKPIVAYGAIETLEGPAAEGVVVVAFKSMEEAKTWYYSEEYQAALQHRLKGAVYRGILVEGV